MDFLGMLFIVAAITLVVLLIVNQQKRSMGGPTTAPAAAPGSKSTESGTSPSVQDYGRVIASALIQSGFGLTRVTVFESGYVKVRGNVERLLGISGDSSINKKTSLGRSAATLATFMTPMPGFNLLSPNQRGRVALMIVTDKNTYSFSTDQVHPSTVRDYQTLLVAGNTVLQQLEVKTLSEARTIAGPEKGSADLSAQLSNLAQLHAQGVLSDEEFAKSKAKLIDG